MKLTKSRLLLLVSLLVGALILLYGLNRVEPTEDFQALDPWRHMISPETVNRLFDEAPSLWEREGGYQDLFVTCIFFEGIGCYYIPHTMIEGYDFGYHPEIESDANRIDRDFSGYIIVNELIPQIVERARNNTVVLHCQRKRGRITACAINHGYGSWQSLRLKASPLDELIYVLRR